MSRLIDADALCRDLLDRWSIADTRKEEMIRAVMADVVTPIVACQPTIEERKRGEWIANGDIHTECPFCGEDWDKYVFGEIWYTGELPNFCPHCGADMRGEERREE